MKIDADVTIAELCRALGRGDLLGTTIQSVDFTITYSLDGTDRSLSVSKAAKDRLTVEVIADEDEVRHAVGDPWDDYREDALPTLDDADLHDFIAACTSGDRAMAIALSSRLFDGHNAMTAEQLLLTSAHH